MGQKDQRVDAYIVKAAPFAQPVLSHFRELMHKACPEIKENIKWGMPAFELNGIVTTIASFKNHLGIAFHKSALMPDPHKIFHSSEDAIGHLGKITSLADLPEDNVLISYIQEAAKLDKEGKKVTKKPAKPKAEVQMPDYFAAALEKNPAAKQHFESFSPSAKREYIEWLIDAKSEATRNSRLERAMEWIAEGKPRLWKYQKK
jgi:uncharacterized protein YdeI (YjbR/CyaY-like superfamily)